MCFETTRPLEGLTANSLQRQRAINRYYENPNYCKKCEKLIQIECGKQANYTRSMTFCSHSCAASFNNLGVSRFNGEGLLKERDQIKCKCGNNITFKATRCDKCRSNEILFKTLNEVKRKQYPHWNQVRRHARKVMNLSNIPKHCPLCSSNEFDAVIEVCHIKDISDFPETALISEVNDISNLTYLCPSHHALFDRKLIRRNEL